jgi:hypothetical protein
MAVLLIVLIVPVLLALADVSQDKDLPAEHAKTDSDSALCGHSAELGQGVRVVK